MISKINATCGETTFLFVLVVRSIVCSTYSFGEVDVCVKKLDIHHTNRGMIPQEKLPASPIRSVCVFTRGQVMPTPSSPLLFPAHPRLLLLLFPYLLSSFALFLDVNLPFLQYPHKRLSKPYCFLSMTSDLNKTFGGTPSTLFRDGSSICTILCRL